VNAHWRERPEGGGLAALWLIRFIALHGGRRLARALLYPVTLYFFLRRGAERRASRSFLSRARQRPASTIDVLRHLHVFASATLDRVYMLAHGERYFDLDVEGLELLHRALDSQRGMLLVGSHLGSFEAMRLLSRRQQDKPLRVVLDRQQGPAVTALLDALAPDIACGVIDGSRDPASVVLAVGEAAQQGHMIGLMADRGRPDERMAMVPFLGQPAPFPLGPWMLAAALRIPVLLCYGLYLGGNRYKLRFESFADTVSVQRADRSEAVERWVHAYARSLERQARAHPCNWFNFYDFWNAPTSLDAAGAAADRDSRRMGAGS